MKLSTQIKPISYLKSHTAQIVKELTDSRQPMVITQNGEATLVVMDVKSFEEHEQTLALLKLLALGNKAIEQGRVLQPASVIALEEIAQHDTARGLIGIDTDEYCATIRSSYIVKNFSVTTWRATYAKLKLAIRNLALFPQLGGIPSELETLNLTQYRQILSGKNRVIYEVRQDAVYVHLIVDARRDLKEVLMQRLLR